MNRARRIAAAAPEKATLQRRRREAVRAYYADGHHLDIRATQSEHSAHEPRTD